MLNCLRNFSPRSFGRTGLKIVLLLITSCSLLTVAGYAALTEKNFKQDMVSYQRNAKLKHLNANERLYILDRYRQKYHDAEFDLTDLYAEIDRCTSMKQKETEKTGKKKSGILTKVLVTQGKTSSRLLLNLSGSKQYREVLTKDKKGLQPPVISLYLYNATAKLKPTSKNFRVKNGPIRQVQSKTISVNPPTVKVSVSLRDDYPYSISQNKNQLILTVERNKSAQTPETDAKEISTIPPVAGVAAPTILSSAELHNSEEEVLTASSEPAKEVVVTTIETGDIVDVHVEPATEFSQQRVVQPNGTMQMLLIGELKAAGLSREQLESEIAKKLSEFVSEPQVKISIRRLDPNQIFLVGQVKTPGRYDLLKPWRCFELISKTGGFLNDADKKNIVIHRGGTAKGKIEIFNAEEFLITTDPSKDIALALGDIIEVPQIENHMFIYGAVKTPGRYEFSEGMKVMQAIYLAGGFTGKTQTRNIQVIRNENDRKTVREIKINDLMKKLPKSDITLKPGDLIIVPKEEIQRKDSFTRTVLPWTVFFTSLGLALAFLI